MLQTRELPKPAFYRGDHKLVQLINSWYLPSSTVLLGFCYLSMSFVLFFLVCMYLILGPVKDQMGYLLCL